MTKHKLKTTVVHSFNIDDEMDDLDFSMEIAKKAMEMKKKIVIVNTKKKIKQDASTRLF